MPRLKVRGNCPKCGSDREELADTGRVTWRGPCNKKGCDGTLILRKFHTSSTDGNTSPDNGNADTTPPTTRRGTPRKVPKVGYNQPPESDSANDSGNKPPEVPGSTGDGQPADSTSDQPPTVVAGKPERKRRRREYPYAGLFNW